MLDESASHRLGDLISIKHGYAFASERFAWDGPYVLLTPGNFVESGGFRWLGEKQKFFDGAVPSGFILRAGDMLVAMTEQAPGLLGSTLFVPRDRTYLHNQRLGLIRVKAVERLHADYLHYFLSLPAIRQRIGAEAAGTKVRHTSPERLYAIELTLPPLPEQRKIAAILRTWDEALDKLAVLRAAKEQRLKALRERLLFGGTRMGQHRINWLSRRIGEVTHELTARNGDMALGRDLVMGVTNAAGIVPMREQTVAEDIGRYKRLPPRAFAYNPMRINVGSIAMNAGDRTVLVSPDYIVFACNADGMEADYLNHLRQTRWWLHHINSGGSGSVRQRTYYDDLAALHLPLPDLAEQRAIVDVLNSAEAEVAATDRMIEAITRQKRGLMQKLLTGEWPVIIDKD